MKTTSKIVPNRSPVPGVVPEPHVHDDDADPQREAAQTAADPAAEREARQKARDEQRSTPGQRRAVMIPRRDKRLPFEAPAMRVVATAGIVAISVVVAAIMGSQNSHAWLVGLVVSLVSLVLAAVLWSSRRL